eukprot:771806-Pyramimonas_sp.AAC.1
MRLRDYQADSSRTHEGQRHSQIRSTPARSPSKICQDFYKRWASFDGSQWTGKNLWPCSCDAEDIQLLEKKYRAIPEEFYHLSQLPIITPINAMLWVDHMKGFKLHLQERMAGSGRLSYRCMKLCLQVAFPVEYRYGWNLADAGHHNVLAAVRAALGIKTS